jgi:hypothetical protein
LNSEAIFIVFGQLVGKTTCKWIGKAKYSLKKTFSPFWQLIETQLTWKKEEMLIAYGMWVKQLKKTKKKTIVTVVVTSWVQFYVVRFDRLAMAITMYACIMLPAVLNRSALQKVGWRTQRLCISHISVSSSS